MKKPQSNFVVEYKAGRRRAPSKSGSIWGNVDLRTFVDDGEDEKANVVAKAVNASESTDEVAASEALTASSKQTRNSDVAKEGPMADETNVESNLNTASTTSAPPVTEPKKRGPRAKRATPDAASADVAVQTPSSADVTWQKRGRKSAAAKTKSPKSSAPKPITRQARKPAEATAGASVAASDEMADLLALEQENQRLRKLLSEKLRDENATLRRRLGLD